MMKKNSLRLPVFMYVFMLLYVVIQLSLSFIYALIFIKLYKE